MNTRGFPDEELEVYEEEAVEIQRGLGFQLREKLDDGRAWLFSGHPLGAILRIPTEPQTWFTFLAMARDALMQRGEAMA